MCSFLTVIFSYLSKDYSATFYMCYIISITSAISIIIILLNVCLKGINEYYLIIVAVCCYIGYYTHFYALIYVCCGTITETLNIVLGSTFKTLFLILFISTGFFPYILAALGFTILALEECKKCKNWF